MKKPLLLLVTHGLGLEGAPRSLANIARGLAATGFWRVAVFSHVDGPLRKELEAAGVQTILPPVTDHTPLFLAGTSDLECYCRENMRFLHLTSREDWEASIRCVGSHLLSVLREKPLLILGNTVLSFWSVALARDWGLPSAWCIHESEPPFSHLEWLPRDIFDLLPQLLASARRVIFVAQATQEIFANAGHHCHSLVIPLGLPADMPVFAAHSLSRESCREELGLTQDAVCILALGSVFERKGQMDLCRAVAQLPPEARCKLRCHIVGDRPGTPYSDTLHQYVNELSPEARAAIRIFPETRNVAVHYKAADIFVLCSRVESYPFTILEALSMGLPIVTTPVFGIREQLPAGTALFYEPGQVNTLAQHLLQHIRDEDTRKLFASKSRARYCELQKFTDMLDRYVEVCHDVIDSA